MSDLTDPTPIGDDTPDWALVWQGQDAFGVPQDRLYLVRETKSSLDDAARRGTENMKIACATASGRDAAGPPLCLNCGQPMVLRVARRGTHPGEPFWGCPDYPNCRGVRAYERMAEG